jgi:hypothetical protein
MRKRLSITGDLCARCGERFAGLEDRRAQVRGGDLCRACNLDPRSRSLPIEADLDGGWLRRSAKTLIQLIRSPSASFRAVEEPVSHTRVLLFLATLRLPLWLLTITWMAVDTWMHRGEVGPMRFPSMIGVMLGSLAEATGSPIHHAIQFADVLRLWLLLMVPLGLPMLYFFGGILAHVAMAMTGGARRSIGASMRAFGLAIAPALVLVGILDLVLIVLDVAPEIWAAIVRFAAITTLVLMAIALARTHATSLVRGLLVALVPASLFVFVLTARGLLEIHRLPGQPEPQLPNTYIPYPIE